MARRTTEFQTIHSEGGLLPTSLLRQLIDPKAKGPELQLGADRGSGRRGPPTAIAGMQPQDYGFPPDDRLNDAITQSWNRLRRHWADFRNAASRLPEGEAGTGLTNDKWSIPLLRELGFGILPATASAEVGGRQYAINRFFGPTPVHLVGCGVCLDRRAAGVRGAAAANPHGLVQEYLNRSPGHLWAIVSNGLRFRILRDNQALSRQSYLDFDLEAMFTGELFSDFVLFWLVAHATRFVPREDTRPETCWLEQWTKLADELGARALGDLRKGVEKALQILGQGFVGHPRNTALREALRTGRLSLSDFHGQLLRVVYRLIFLFVAEDREIDGVSLLHPRDDSDTGTLGRQRYDEHYSTARLRELASRIKGSRHGDLWQQFNLLVGALSGDERFAEARADLALPVFGSMLWSPSSTMAVNARSLDCGEAAELANADFLEAIRHLAFTQQDNTLRPVDYRNIGAEEIGGVYESLLSLTPQLSGDGARFTFAEFAGNERKTSGSYYTPDCLVQCLLDSALDPVVEEAIKGKKGAEAEKALLSLKVCDPAVGSGHFLVGAAHRLARHLARIRALAQGESEPSPLLYQHALRDVIGRCLYGVDINPMSAELCRVSLWLEALEPGKPLSFLDHHIQVGNSLLGTTPALLAGGIPDDAFTAIEGDVKARVSLLKKQNKRERGEHAQGQGYLFEPHSKPGNMAADFARLNAAPDGTLAEVTAVQERYAELVRGSDYQIGRLLADTWCAAFVWKKDDSDLGKLCPTERDFRKLESDADGCLLPHVGAEVQRLRGQYQFFHWHLAFPNVFRLPDKGERPENEQTGWSGGFDVVLGNPPWERVKLQEKEWFAERSPEIANARNAAERRRLLDALRETDPIMLAAFLDDRRKAEGDSHIVRDGGGYPCCGRGDVNTYALFAELAHTLVSDRGMLGCITPIGLITETTTSPFFGRLMETKSVVASIGFVNEQQIFPAVLHNVKFSLFVASGCSRQTPTPRFTFNCLNVDEAQQPDRSIFLSWEDICLMNPSSRTCPTFFTRQSFEVSRAIYQRIPIVKDTDLSGWNIAFYSMLHMSGDSELFHTSPSDSRLAVYESKMFHQYNHRSGTFDGAGDGERIHMLPEPSLSQLSDPHYGIRPCYFIDSRVVLARLQAKQPNRYLVAFRDVTSVHLGRTCICASLPLAGAGHSVTLVTFNTVDPKTTPLFIADMNSFAHDFCVRQKLAGFHLSAYIAEQTPLIPVRYYSQSCHWQREDWVSAWLLPRVLELTYTAWDLEPFARDCGYAGPPFRWDEERRFKLRAELDAAFFHLYLPATPDGQWKPARKADGAVHDETAGELDRLKASFPTPRDAVEYIMETFPIVKRKDVANHGDYRTKLVILDMYDRMQFAIATGEPYQTTLDPPPADPRVAHPPRAST